MKRSLLFFGLASLVTLMAVPSSAAKPKKTTAAEQQSYWDWWNVYSVGESPNRYVFYINARSVEAKHDLEALQSGTVDFMKPPPYVEAETVVVYENAQSPARVNFYTRVNCATQQIMFLKQWRLKWQIDESDTLPPTQWSNAGDAPELKQMVLFMCDPKARTEKNLMTRADQVEDPLPRTWAVMWSGAQQPKFSTNKTLEQAQADLDKTIARSTATLAQGMQQATETRQRILRDEKVTAQEQKALFSKMRSKASPVLHSWLGAEERSLVGSWGVPTSSYDAVGARFITYTEGYATQMEDQYGNVQAGSRNEFYCDMTFEIREGVIKDYRSGGNYCGTASSGKPRGPN
jgi:hypothetical protein